MRVNTVDPWRPTITADVTSTHSNYQPAEVLLLIDGQRHSAIHPDASGTYTFEIPPIAQFGDVTTHLDIEACDSEYRCGMGNAEMTRFTPSALEATDTLHLWRYEGRTLRRATYGHAFRQVYATTYFSVPEEGENSRYQLKENSVQLAWTNPHPPTTFSAQAQSQISLYSNSMSLGWCSWGDPVCYADGCRAACGYFGSFGTFAPAVDENVTSVFTENAEAWAITGGAELRVQAP